MAIDDELRAKLIASINDVRAHPRPAAGKKILWEAMELIALALGVELIKPDGDQ
jgi:hypothetical protein